jgi:hypothetical protein
MTEAPFFASRAPGLQKIGRNKTVGYSTYEDKTLSVTGRNVSSKLLKTKNNQITKMTTDIMVVFTAAI